MVIINRYYDCIYILNYQFYHFKKRQCDIILIKNLNI